ncbi:MAG: hypothetical protein AAGE65_13000 [Planctomycetota bacterium]
MPDPSFNSPPPPSSGGPPVEGFDVVRELQRLETLRDPIAEHSGRSNRQAERYSVREEAMIYPMSRRGLDDAGQTVFLRDIGRRGVGFLSDRALPIDHDFRVVFLRGGYAVGESAIGVRYCRPVRTDLFLVGANFVAGAGLLTTLGVDPASLEAEYRGQAGQHRPNQNAA